MLWAMGDDGEYTLRRAAAADAPAVAALHADSWRRHYHGAYSDSYLDGDVAADRLAVWSQRLGTPDPSRVTVVAGAADGLAGFAHVVLGDDPRWGALVDNLHVAAAHQRRGLGSRLMAAAARAVGAGPMYLWVLEQNTAGRAFYAAIGGRLGAGIAVPPPGGVASRLCGAPVKLRVSWPDAAELTGT